MQRSRSAETGSRAATRFPPFIISMRSGSPPFDGSFSSAILSPANSPFGFAVAKYLLAPRIGDFRPAEFGGFANFAVTLRFHELVNQIQVRRIARC